MAICMHLAGCFAGDATDHVYVSFDVSPSGRDIAFCSAEGDLFLLDTEATHVRRLTRGDTIETDPAFSPGGGCIAYSGTVQGEQGSRIFALTLSNLERHRLTIGQGVNDVMPSYSSDGSTIAFARAHRRRPYSLGGWTWDDWDVYTIASDGRNIRRVTNECYYSLTSPKFSRDGRTIFYSCDPIRSDGDVCHIILGVDVKGANRPRVLTPNVQRNGGLYPDVSHDGRRIVFVSDRKEPFSYDLYMMNEDGTQASPLNVLRVSRYNVRPRFSIDGKSVFFLAATRWSANSGPLFSLWQVDAEGRNPRCVVREEVLTNPGVSRKRTGN